MPEENIQKRDIVPEMRESYLDYAMSVIVARALPDVRDGLKPVHRRILYSMHDLGLGHSAKYRKSAAVVGDTLGKYHPHGDIALYDALARLAQDFSMRYTLIDGQGNFGSIDGDAAAAQRYTEVRMTQLAEELLADIEKDTVDFRDNYDGTRREPSVLPASLPNLLLNGTLGIAVGMATNIPPHNLGEVIDAAVELIRRPKTSVEELTQFIAGPDFPTGGLVFSKKDLLAAYATGRGSVITRGEAEIVEKSKGNFQILISSIPYQVNKSELITKMADLVREKRLEGIRDLRDESDKEGLTIAIDLKHDAVPEKILNSLYKYTDLERAFHFNMIALVDGIQPQVLSLKGILEQFVAWRKLVTERRAKFDLKKTEERAHILEGLKKALDHIDAVIKTIKSSESKEEAHKNLVKKFELSDPQAQAILEMRLATLAGLERQKIEDELKEKQKLIRDLKALLKDPDKIAETVKDELLALKKKYGDARKTKIIASPVKSFSMEDLIPERETIVVLTQDGYVKRVNPEEYKSQKRGGKGIIGHETKEEDAVTNFLAANTHDDLLFFTSRGKVFQTKMYEIPEGKRVSKGKAIQNFLPISQDEKITSILAVPKAKKGQILSFVMITKNGIIKKVDSKHFQDVRRSGIIAIRLQKNDVLAWVLLAEKGDHLVLTTKKGQAIRFKESDARQMGRGAQGVKAIRLKKSDELVGADVISAKDNEALLLAVTENGYGKKTKLGQYRVQRRGGSGIKTAKLTSKTGNLVSAKVISPELEELIAISKKGQVIRTPLKEISVLGRATQGVRIMRLQAKDQLASITCL
ncbi:DNA gyrase subunit A [Candidatus Giovannonibacteria bacterium RIFCSPHIGHO2_01_FULL_48_47]|nr:MAG: DNA gyrase subunit A [Candidatus Giovannonibacteria bacterium RIFCSPHIGHO2_01_FULL_48_47]OGF68559.1 MAG: DNA gyrase subunit A [Candidatus Giovannonibacteria bacterium RIFCSPHIGHO2_02_FULL_48_15]OGF90044.1 MAG: DNA gyrase subunit A [Candidatus Giovannonibacteria bacterium RIFCSPLOWO2_01_FULL_48_47]OGF96235.1 MAG: DNA gyrase subunit A [Candidatus Giovannonibacteria bacterium RIFOXYD1_FULL_48_21]HBT81463.1 DNA gyrase subunit A [Candidatus Giovannonibacteria bacterium]